jgi:hypothetical protein
MVKLRWFAVAGASVLSLAPALVTNAQTPAAPGASAAIYCRGPLSTFRTDGGKVVKTPFKWAKEAAMKENPGAGECAWADRAPQGNEKPGDTSTIIGNLGPFDNIPVGTIGKICVTKASGDSKDVIVKQVVRQLGHETAPFHRPPFSADGCPS